MALEVGASDHLSIDGRRLVLPSGMTVTEAGSEGDVTLVNGGSLPAVGDVTISSDTDASGAGDIILQTGNVERARILFDGRMNGVADDISRMTRKKWLPESSGATLVSTFASGHGWTTGQTATGGSVSLNDTSTPGPFAPQSVTIVNGTASSSFIDKTGLSIDLTGKSLLVWVKYDTQAFPDPNFVIFAGDAALTNYYTLGLSPPPRQSENGWVCLEFFPAGMTAVGTPVISAIAHIRLRINGGGAGTFTVHLGGVATRPTSSGVYANGVVSFTFDDAGTSDFTLARTTLAAYNLPATCFVIADAVGTSGPTALQYRQLQDELGWEIAAHAFTTAAHNTRYENLSAAALDVEFRSLKAFLMTNGFTSESWASPGGTATTAVWLAASRYFNCHRSAGADNTNGSYRQTVRPVQPYYLHAPTWDTSSGSTVANFKALIDAAKAQNTWLIFNFHAVTSAASSGEAISATDLDSLAAYCVAQGVSVRTMAQVLKEAGQSA